MATSLPFRVPVPQDSRSSAKHEQKARRPPVDERVLQLLDDHRPWEILDRTVLAIIDYTYAALLEIVGLVAPPPEEGGGLVKVMEIVHAIGPDSPPVACVIVASARHCLISLITGFDNGNWYEHSKFISQLMETRPQPPAAGAPRASVSSCPGTIHLARAAGGDARPDVTNTKGFLSELDIRWGSSGGNSLLGVLYTVRSHLSTAIVTETRVIRAAIKSGCRIHDKLRDIFTVRTVLDKIRREVDIGVIMHRRAYERQRRAREVGQRRPAAEMDVDEVDEEEVLAKRLKAMHM